MNKPEWSPYKDDKWTVFANGAKPGTVHTINGEEYYIAHPDLRWDTENQTFKDKKWKIGFDWSHIVTSHVINMSYLFSRAKNFNQDIWNWDVSNVIYMTAMFYCAENFNQDLSNWKTPKLKKTEFFVFDVMTNSWEEKNKPRF